MLISFVSWLYKWYFLGAELKRHQEEEAAALRAQQELEEMVPRDAPRVIINVFQETSHGSQTKESEYEW